MEITQEEREYLFDEFGPGIINNTGWLFERENIDGVFPILLVLYSYKKRLGIDITRDGIESYERGTDDILDGLYDASSAFFGGDETNFKRLVDINDCLYSITKKMFDWYYPILVDNILSRTGLMSEKAMMPNMRIARTIANILKEHECESVYTLFPGIGVYSRAFKCLQFTGAEPYAPAILISRVLNDAHHIRSSKYLNINPLKSWPRKEYDAFVSNIPVDVDFFEERRFHLFRNKYNDMQATYFRKVLDKGRAKKVVAGLISFDFANKGEYDNIRKEICDRGLLESVIALPEDIFGNAAKSYIIVLNMAGGRNSATFMDATQSLRRQSGFPSDDHDVRDSVKDGEKTSVAYSVMEKVSWSFNPAVYIQNAECREGQELVRLGDLVSIPKGPFVKGRRTISKAFFSERFAKVALGTTPAEASSSFENIPIDGPSLMMALTAGTRSRDLKLHCAICKDKGQYATDMFVTVLQPDSSKISLEYLALALMNDKSFTDYYKKIQAYYVDDVRFTHILERRIPILTDLAAQKKAVSLALGHADMVDTLYNVLLAGTNQISKMKTTLSRFGCSVLKTADYVEGNGGVEDLLIGSRKPGIPVSKKIDAVVFNTDIALDSSTDSQPYLGLDAMIDLQLVYGKEIPFYAFSTRGIEDIRKAGIISERRLKYFEKGHLFKVQEGDLPTLLVSSLREELESNTSIDTKIRSLHKEAFEAAEWLDTTYPDSNIQSVKVLSDFLIAAERPGEDTTRKISDMRVVAHRMIEILRECRAVPTALDNGAVPHLLYDSEYEIKGKGVTYKQRVEIMPKSLSASLISLVDIGNEGAHTFSSRPNLAMSMAQILMEFIQWFYANKDTFSSKLSGYWTDGNDYETRWDEIVGTAECRIIGREKIWLCKDVRLYVDKRTNIREGDRIVINKRQKQNKDELVREGINWMAYPKDGSKNPDGYIIERNSDKH